MNHKHVHVGTLLSVSFQNAVYRAGSMFRYIANAKAHISNARRFRKEYPCGRFVWIWDDGNLTAGYKSGYFRNIRGFAPVYDSLSDDGEFSLKSVVCHVMYTMPPVVRVDIIQERSGREYSCEKWFTAEGGCIEPSARNEDFKADASEILFDKDSSARNGIYFDNGPGLI